VTVTVERDRIVIRRAGEEEAEAEAESEEDAGGSGGESLDPDDFDA
jgi:hypothetical protein